ncbi:MAG TPA: hypothetical protein VGA70_14850 [Longimicrobiales bacterium]|jgi:hypothetical protein
MSDASSQDVMQVTIVAAGRSGGAWITHGNEYVQWPGTTDNSVYWFVVFSRADMSIVANVASNSSSAVPPEIAKYAGDNGYILILVTNNLAYSKLPTGDLATFIAANGGGTRLTAAEQVAEHAGSAAGGWFVYGLLAILGEPQPGIEDYSLSHSVVLAASVRQFGGLWTPVNAPA